MKIVQAIGLTAYGLLARTGLMRQPWARRAFIEIYALYKTWVEAGPIDRLKDFVTPGSLVIDVGANIGFFSLKFADWVGDEGLIIAIEPDRENFTTLVKKAQSTGLESRIRFLNVAASDKAGSVPFERNELHPGDHRIAPGTNDGPNVPAVTLDELLAETKGRSLSLVKIDVQGAEMLVLAGAEQMLRNRCPALFVEVDDGALRHFGKSADAFVSSIESAGYRTYELTKGQPRLWPREQLFADLDRRGYLDVLLLPVEASDP